MTDFDEGTAGQPMKPNAAMATAAAERCSNEGRWGAVDQLGTLNHITAEVRLAAVTGVRTGQCVSIARPIDTYASAINPRPAWHVMHLETERPYASADALHLQTHGLATTHLDALGHMFLDGTGYNGRSQGDVVTMSGLRELGVGVMRDGIVTRGVFLDVAAAAGRPWLAPGDFVGRELLEAAERSAGVRVRTGDAVIVHVGLERREATEGTEDPSVRAGLDLEAVEWLYERDVSLYAGDCIERFPLLGEAVPMPLHQIALARMGMPLLDCPSLSRLLEACGLNRRWHFLLIVAPLVVPGGTGSPVNPLAVF